MPFKPPDLTSTGILDRAKDDHDWTTAGADEAKKWYVRFLELRHGGNPIEVMAEKADLLWHTHILFTDRYRDYCQEVFGRYLDHTPTDPRRKPTATQIAAATKAYNMGPIPDAVSWCL